MFEFLVALMATLELWGQVGGQGHLDLMPWYTKLALTIGMALITVMGTVSAVAHQQAWNAKTIACLVLALMLAAGMAGATYYYHLHESQDQSDQDDDVSGNILPGNVFPAPLRLALRVRLPAHPSFQDPRP
jgi:hypothetical protein